MFLEMQNFAFRERLRISRKMIFQICSSCAPRHSKKIMLSELFKGGPVFRVSAWTQVLYPATEIIFNSLFGDAG